MADASAGLNERLEDVEETGADHEARLCELEARLDDAELDAGSRELKRWRELAEHVSADISADDGDADARDKVRAAFEQLRACLQQTERLCAATVLWRPECPCACAACGRLSDEIDALEAIPKAGG
jgi:predicted  nucleic acid-binding Zn-ribbon protein